MELLDTGRVSVVFVADRRPPMTRTATLNLDGKTYELPVHMGAEAEVAIDVGDLRERSGAITLDVGYGNTGSCTSAITFLDGDKGILRYRGYPIEQLAEHSTFLEVCYLLIRGQLPTSAELEAFRRTIDGHALVQKSVWRLYKAFPQRAHPMAMLAAGFSHLATLYQDELDLHDEAHVQLNIARALAKAPALAAHAYRHGRGESPVDPESKLDYPSNFLRMTFGNAKPYRDIDPVLARAVDILLILHADHEQNCSTSSVRLVGSAHANMYAALASGVLALWGPRHGGANESALEMLSKIYREKIAVKDFVQRVKDRKALLMGFGHRVYKNFDPRGKIIQVLCGQVLDRMGVSDPLLDLARELEAVALADDYFIARKLYPNVDYYSGIIYKALGFPPNMFTVLFALGRMSGWIAQWLEMMRDKSRIGRPRQLYVGEGARDYIPQESRITR
jgi:citrate synthase